MKIVYYSSSTFFYPFLIGNKHFKAAFASKSKESLELLWKQNIIQDPKQPLSLFGRVQHFILGLLEYIPLIGIIVAIADRYFNNDQKDQIDRVISQTSKFNNYAFGLDGSVHLTGITIRPANLFFEALLGDNNPTTKPGSGELFRFYDPLSTIHDKIMKKGDSEIISVSARGQKIPFPMHSGKRLPLESILGNDIYQISASEVKEMLNSQRIYVSPLIPRQFYLEMKQAMDADAIITLFKENSLPSTLQEILLQYNDRFTNLHAFLQKVKQSPAQYGFVKNGTMFSFDQLLPLSLYQIGSMLVKAEDYHCFVDEGYRIGKRTVGEKDAIRLISASGIRDFHYTHTISENDKHQIDRKIMKHTFKTAFQAIGKEGIAIFPAVGMGVWGGDPDVYWRALLDAAVESKVDLQNILINPNHQETPLGRYKNCSGEEFSLILEEYIKKNPSNHNLKKIINLFDQKTDLLLLAKNLKKAFPDKIIALFNASDPDVTLGNHVGEYVNNISHAATTEENFAAAGTSGLGFEQITQVRQHPKRVIQAQ